MENIEVVVVGSANIDQTVMLETLPKTGETLTGSLLHIVEGGKGANQAVAAARMGAKTAFVGCVGEDEYGIQMKKRLSSENVNCQFLYTKPDVPTGSAFIFLDNSGQNMIAVVAGANNAINCEDIKNSSHIISGAKILLLQHEIPQEVIEYTAKIAHDSGVKVILNPAPARVIPKSLFQYLTCIIPNETESQKITGIAGADIESLKLQSDWFHQRGLDIAIVTLGEKGVYVSNGSKSDLILAQKVKALDSVAAGDCFCGTIAAAVAKDMDWFGAAEFASKSASIAVTRKGAMDSIPFLTELKGIC